MRAHIHIMSLYTSTYHSAGPVDQKTAVVEPSPYEAFANRPWKRRVLICLYGSLAGQVLRLYLEHPCTVCREWVVCTCLVNKQKKKVSVCACLGLYMSMCVCVCMSVWGIYKVLFNKTKYTKSYSKQFYIEKKKTMEQALGFTTQGSTYKKFKASISFYWKSLYQPCLPGPQKSCGGAAWL